MNEDKASTAYVGDHGDNNSDDDEVTEVSNAQKAFVQSNNSKKQLLLMCVGLSEGGAYIFDLDADPWNTIKNKV